MSKGKLITACITTFIIAMGLGFLFCELARIAGSEDAETRSEETETERAETRKGDLRQEEETDEPPDEAVEEEAPPESREPPKKEVTVAWQPSHQDDTGDANWHEYDVCNDIVERAMPLCTRVENVKCWDISHGLTGTNNYRPQPTNTVAFDVEIAQANQAQADYFISVHNDAGAPSGILGICMPDDPVSYAYLEQIINTLCARTGMPSRGIWTVRLYSLEPERNNCPCRVLLEIGDYQSDYERLMNPEFRQLVAEALAEVVNSLPPLR